MPGHRTAREGEAVAGELGIHLRGILQGTQLPFRHLRGDQVGKCSRAIPPGMKPPPPPFR